MAEKSNEITVEQRIETVANMLLSGVRRAGIIQHADKKAWGIHSRQIDTYIARAKVLIREQNAVPREDMLATARGRLELLFKASLGVSDIKTALSVQKEINTLESLYAPPAPRTLNLSSNDAALLDKLITHYQARGIEASTVFNALLAKIAEEAA